jgi:hypothetical protein
MMTTILVDFLYQHLFDAKYQNREGKDYTDKHSKNEVLVDRFLTNSTWWGYVAGSDQLD